MTRYFPTLYKVFFIGLILQFVLQTFVTHQLWLEWWVWSAVWLWKEILVIVIWWWMVIDLSIHRQRTKIFQHAWIKWFVLLLVSCIWLAATTHFLGVWWSVNTFVMAFKYDFFWFTIMLVGLWASWRLSPDQQQELIQWTISAFKWMLLLSIVRYGVVSIKPGILKYLWFNPFSYEWSVWTAPPAMYYTHINQWLARNSFLFERPTTRWFFLVALRPLLYLWQLRKRDLSHVRIWRGIMGANILITFSRAARWAWIITTLICIALTTNNLKKLIIKYALPLLVVFSGISYLWYQQIFARTYSNTGHVAMLVQAVDMIWASPWLWYGWATAWPGSHRNWEWFNPENQFLQLWVEFGLGWFILWTLLFASIIWLWWKYRHDPVVLAVWVGMTWLWISGLVLHSFADRMVVYPWMMLVGVVIAHHFTRISSSSDTLSD